MKKAALQALAVCLLALGTGISGGCKNKNQPEATVDLGIAEAARKFPEGTNVLAALESKDYEAAVSGLAKVQSSLSDEQRDAYRTLMQHVKSTLIDAAGNDPKAAEALNGLRILTLGR